MAAMKLTDDQKQQVTHWISGGAKLAEVQNRLIQEFGIKLTYMEARFLVDDLMLKLKDPEPAKVPASGVISPTPAPSESPKEPTGAPGKVSVTVDQIARPGAIVSGKVTFSDGQGADWYLDQTGRLGLVPKQTGYKPNAADVQEFQLALQQEVAKLGY